MKLALEELGYKKVYHFFEVSENVGHTQRWIEALEVKYGENRIEPKTLTKTEWHELFKDYNVHPKHQILHKTKTDSKFRQ
jgi:hypothetical protein